MDTIKKFPDSLNKDSFNMQNHVSAMAEFFEKIDIRNATIVVQDWGGPIGLVAVARTKIDIAGLVVLTTGFVAPRPTFLSIV